METNDPLYPIYENIATIETKAKPSPAPVYPHALDALDTPYMNL